jgi:hypothetical protein
MEDFASHVPARPGCTTPRYPLVGDPVPVRRVSSFGLGFLQTPPHDVSPCPSPCLRLRENLARGLSPLKFCAMPGTHGKIQRLVRIGSCAVLQGLYQTARFRGYVDFARVASSKSISTVKNGISALVSPRTSPSGETSQLQPANAAFS